MHWYVNYPESEAFLTPMHNIDFSYPAHLHGCLELSLCIHGEVEVVINGVPCLLQAGFGVLIPPNTVHSYYTKDTSEYYTILFSRNLLPDFSALFFHKVPRNYLFALGEPLNRQILEFYHSDRTLFGGKSLLYRSAEAFLRDNTFLDANPDDDDLTRQLITYIQDNLCEEITLQDVADYLGYSYFYISKRIRQVFHISFTELLAQYRVARVKMLLESGTQTISQAALSCGFGSIRSFNRIFHQVTGLTPSQYLSHPSHSVVSHMRTL